MNLVHLNELEQNYWQDRIEDNVEAGPGPSTLGASQVQSTSPTQHPGARRSIVVDSPDPSQESTVASVVRQIAPRPNVPVSEGRHPSKAELSKAAHFVHVVWSYYSDGEYSFFVKSPSNKLMPF